MKILFVCSGNTCRSPMAEVIAREKAKELGMSLGEFRSAGTSTIPGLPASDGALEAARRNGLDLNDHRSSPLSLDLVAWADLVLTMGPAHLIRVLETGGTGKSALLGAYSEGDDESMDPAVPDPFGGGDEVYEATYRTLHGMVGAALERLAREEGR